MTHESFSSNMKCQIQKAHLNVKFPKSQSKQANETTTTTKHLDQTQTNKTGVVFLEQLSAQTFCFVLVYFFAPLRHPTDHHVVQGQPQSTEGDGAAHQPDFPLPAKSFPRPSLALREHFAAHRGTHCGLRRVHESGAGRRRGVPREDEEPENTGPHHAEGR